MKSTNGDSFTPMTISEAELAMLERLSNCVGVSGGEDDVRNLVLGAIRPFVDELLVDLMGNILATRYGEGGDRLRVMLAAHMDEVGFIITADDGDGVYRFDKVGGLALNWMPGKSVLVGKENLTGFIGVKPIHLLEDDERSRPLGVRQLRVNLGPKSVGKVHPGDLGTYATRFRVCGNTMFGKALDDRLGVATLIELVRRAPKHIDLLAAFTVQEELGLRGAGIAAHRLSPDLAIAIDSTPAFDLPTWDGSENTRYNSRLDHGPAIYIADRGTLSDPRLVRHLVYTAETRGIPYQLRQPGGGGTDAGAIHRQRDGIPSVSVSVPGRYAHSPIMAARISDWQATVNLLLLSLQGMERNILERGEDEYR